MSEAGATSEARRDSGDAREFSRKAYGDFEGECEWQMQIRGQSALLDLDPKEQRVNGYQADGLPRGLFEGDRRDMM